MKIPRSPQLVRILNDPEGSELLRTFIALGMNGENPDVLIPTTDQQGKAIVVRPRLVGGATFLGGKAHR